MLEALAFIGSLYLIIALFVTIYSSLDNGEDFFEAITSGLFWLFWLTRNVAREFVRRLKQG